MGDDRSGAGTILHGPEERRGRAGAYGRRSNHGDQGGALCADLTTKPWGGALVQSMATSSSDPTWYLHELSRGAD